MNKRSIHFLFPLLLIWVLLLWKPGLTGYIASPLLLLGAVAWLLYGLYKVLPDQLPSHRATGNKGEYKPLLLFALLSLIAVWWAHLIFSGNPIDIAKSDIIPLIGEVYCKRFLAGTFVYDSVTGYDYQTWTPNYLPFHWIPFVPAFYFGFDPRWIPFGLFLTVQGTLAWLTQKSAVSAQEKLFKISLPFLFLFTIMLRQKDAFAHTVELLISSYYVLLGIGIAYQIRTLSVFGYLFTLLSRYVSAFFLPVSVLLDIRSKNRSALLVYPFILLLFVLFYVWPFLSVDPGVFFRGAAAYDIAALGEWDGQSWQPAGDNPFQLFQGFGFASWFYTWYPGPLETKIHALKTSLLVLMSGTMLLLLLIPGKYAALPGFRLAALLLLLTLFYSFVLVPYNYLFWNLIFLFPVVLSRVKLFTSNKTNHQEAS